MSNVVVTPAFQGIWVRQPNHTCGLRHLYRFEPIVASIGLVAATPLLISVAIIIAILSGKAPLVRHSRVGYGGAELSMLKFRTMWRGRSHWKRPYLIEDVSGTVPVNKQQDERVNSHFALWCRRYSIDELPQLYHIACGEMSFVGPRPITSKELSEHYGDDAKRILTLKPGLTGLWQVLGRSRLTYSQRKRLDLWLVQRASPSLYFRILWRSVPQVLHGYNAH